MSKRLSVIFALLCASAAFGQAVYPLLQPHQFFVDGNGAACAGCSLYTYVAGTTTPQPTYTDSTGAHANTNPVILDVTGSASIWVTPAVAYKYVLKDTLGTIVWTADNVTSSLCAVGGNVIPEGNGTGGCAASPLSSNSDNSLLTSTASIKTGLSTLLLPGASIQAALDAGQTGILLTPGGVYTGPNSIPNGTTIACSGWMLCQLNYTAPLTIGVPGGVTNYFEASMLGVVFDFGGAANGLTLNDVLYSHYQVTVQNTTGVGFLVLGTCSTPGDPSTCANNPWPSSSNAFNEYDYIKCSGTMAQCMVLNGNDNSTCTSGQQTGGAVFYNNFGDIISDHYIGTYGLEMTSGVDSNHFKSVVLRSAASAKISGYSGTGGTLTLTGPHNFYIGDPVIFTAGGADPLFPLNGLTFTVLPYRILRNPVPNLHRSSHGVG